MIDIYINAEETLLKQLALSYGLQDYVWLMDEIRKMNVSVLDERGQNQFQTKFNNIYRIRRNAEWRKEYYDYFERVKYTCPSFKDILTHMYEKTPQHSLEPSFCSKMLATIDADKPIWDSRVLKILELSKNWENNRCMDNAVDIYDEICRRYKEYLEKQESKKAIEVFDCFLPEYKRRISDTKKVDFMLWSMGAEIGKH